MVAYITHMCSGSWSRTSSRVFLHGFPANQAIALDGPGATGRRPSLAPSSPASRWTRTWRVGAWTARCSTPSTSTTTRPVQRRNSQDNNREVEDFSRWAGLMGSTTRADAGGGNVMQAVMDSRREGEKQVEAQRESEVVH